MQESDTHDQHGHNPSSPWDDHWLIAALLALGMVWIGVRWPTYPGQPASKRL